MTIDQTPLYNLNAVLKETGLKADVLRAWEHRYQLPLPQRSPGGHRLYSAYDIETIKWLKARQFEGLSISRAVELWREILQSGRDPLTDYGQHGSQVQAAAPLLETRIEALRDLWLDACLSFDDLTAEDALNQAFALYPVETVCSEILQQGLATIGQGWYGGRVSVQQEHFASALASRRVETLISAAPPPTRRQTVLMGCPPSEWHTLPVLILSLYLRRKGVRVTYLGANIPALQIEDAAETIRPDLVVLAAQQLVSAASLQELAVSLQNINVSLAYGGLIFNRIPALRQRIPAHFLGESLEEGSQTIDRLLVNPTPAPPFVQPSASARDTALLFRENRPLIERDMIMQFDRSGLDSTYIEEANTYFMSALSAALDLGDITLLEADLNWVNQLNVGQPLPGERLHDFLTISKQSLKNFMGEYGAPIIAWMDDFLTRHQPKTDDKEK